MNTNGFLDPMTPGHTIARVITIADCYKVSIPEATKMFLAELTPAQISEYDQMITKVHIDAKKALGK